MSALRGLVDRLQGNINRWRELHLNTISTLSTALSSTSSNDVKNNQEILKIKSEFNEILWEMLDAIQCSQQGLRKLTPKEALDQGPNFCALTAVDTVLVMEEIVEAYNQQYNLLEQITSHLDVSSPSSSSSSEGHKKNQTSVQLPNIVSLSAFESAWQLQSYVAAPASQALVARLQLH